MTDPCSGSRVGQSHGLHGPLEIRAGNSGVCAVNGTMNPDFVDLLRAFLAADVRFMVVDAYALEAWSDRLTRPFGPLAVPFIDRASFVRNKRATGRPKDLADVEGLE